MLQHRSGETDPHSPIITQQGDAKLPTEHTILAFVLVSLAITVLPGPSTLFVLTQGLAHGRRGALAAMCGIEIASALRVLATAAGLSAVLASSAIVFDGVRWAGVAYLAYLGIRALKPEPSRRSQDTARTPIPAACPTRKGIAVGLGNPKMAMFFLAFFPQFTHRAQGSITEQILILGAIFWVIGVIWDLTIAFAAGSIGDYLHNRPRIQVIKPRVEGATYLALAGWAAISGA